MWTRRNIITNENLNKLYKNKLSAWLQGWTLAPPGMLFRTPRGCEHPWLRNPVLGA